MFEIPWVFPPKVRRSSANRKWARQLYLVRNKKTKILEIILHSQTIYRTKTAKTRIGRCVNGEMMELFSWRSVNGEMMELSSWRGVNGEMMELFS